MDSFILQPSGHDPLTRKVRAANLEAATEEDTLEELCFLMSYSVSLFYHPEQVRFISFIFSSNQLSKFLTHPQEIVKISSWWPIVRFKVNLTPHSPALAK